jgi:protein phosphatase
MSDPTEEETLVFVPAENFTDDFFVPATPPVELAFGAATHVGRIRANNEDHYAVVRRNRSSEVLATNLQTSNLTFTDDHAYIMVVADGMGGANFGEFASGLALRTMFQLASQATSWVMKLTDFDQQQIPQRVAAYVERMQGALRDYTIRHPEFAGMGTTWTLAYLLPPHGIVVHVGDSRAYLFRDGQLRQITHDETVAQAFIDAGLAPASVKKFGHILLNSFGGDKDHVAAQIHQIEIAPGDQLLLCTDGLTGMVPDDAIAEHLRRGAAPQAACDALIDRALDVGGKDNITVVLAAAAATDDD